MLDLGVTDIAASAIRCAVKYKADAVEELKFMSKLTADLSVALINASGEKELNAEEQEQFLSIKKLTDSLGNLQFRINRLIIAITKMEKLGEQIASGGQVLLDAIMETQTNLIAIRADINDLGHFSKNSQLSSLFAKQNGDRDYE